MNRHPTPKTNNIHFTDIVTALVGAIPSRAGDRYTLACKAAAAALKETETKDAVRAVKKIAGGVTTQAADAISRGLDHRWSTRRDRLFARVDDQDPFTIPFACRAPDLAERRTKAHYEHMWEWLLSMPTI